MKNLFTLLAFFVLLPAYAQTDNDTICDAAFEFFLIAD